VTLVADYTSIFERLVTASDVEGWMTALLKRWAGTYLAEAERSHGYDVGSLARPRGYVRTPTFDKWNEDQLPTVCVISPGTVGPPKRDGRGRYRARWAISVGVIVSASTLDATHELAELYVAAFRQLVLQRPSLDGHANGVTWAEERYDELPFDDLRSLGVGQVAFEVEVENVVTSNAGPVTPDDPLEPDTDAWPPWARVRTHDVTVDPVGIDEPMPHPPQGGEQ
jgi:hypothetical protein